jgi:hypothetical protein
LLAIETEDPFLTPEAFVQALRYLYGGPLLQFESLPESPHVEHDDDDGDDVGRARSAEASKRKVKHALAYIAAGHLLQLPAVACRGADITSQLISWDTVEHVLAFAMTGGLDPEWKTGEVSPSTNGPMEAASRRPSIMAAEHRSQGSISSTASTLNFPIHAPANGTNPADSAPPTYHIAANRLLHEALGFIIHNFPTDFTLDTTPSVERPLYSRLPSTSDHHSRALSASLNSIRFGDYPSADSESLSPAVTALSRILIFLPFPVLKHVLESPQLGSPSGWTSARTRQHVARAVVDERERARIAALKSTTISSAERKARTQEWEVLAWAEGVVTTYGGTTDGVELVRKWKGLRSAGSGPRTKARN